MSDVPSSVQCEETIHTPAFVQQPKPVGNDRFWLRYALGGVAAVALVGWLMMLHSGDGTRDARKKQDGGASQSPAAAMEPQNTLVPLVEKLLPVPTDMGSAEVSPQPYADTAQRSARMAPAASSLSPSSSSSSSSEKKAKELSATAELPLCPEEKLADQANSHRANSKSQQRAREEANKADSLTCRPRKPAETLGDPKELQPPEPAAER